MGRANDVNDVSHFIVTILQWFPLLIKLFDSYTMKIKIIVCLIEKTKRS